MKAPPSPPHLNPAQNVLDGVHVAIGDNGAQKDPRLVENGLGVSFHQRPAFHGVLQGRIKSFPLPNVIQEFQRERRFVAVLRDGGTERTHSPSVGGDVSDVVVHFGPLGKGLKEFFKFTTVNRRLLPQAEPLVLVVVADQGGFGKGIQIVDALLKKSFEGSGGVLGFGTHDLPNTADDLITDQEIAESAEENGDNKNGRQDRGQKAPAQGPSAEQGSPPPGGKADDLLNEIRPQRPHSAKTSRWKN